MVETIQLDVATGTFQALAAGAPGGPLVLVLHGFPDAPPALSDARRRGLRIGVLTNNSASLSPSRMLEASGLGALVDVALSAQMIGAKKPEPRAYHAVAEALRAPAGSCIYFDDAMERVVGARAVGMRAFHVDRKRARHDLAAGIVADLGALPAILDG